LTFLDKERSYFPFRFFLIVLFLVTTVVNNDHPVRPLQRGVPKQPSTSLNDHFIGWLHHLSADSVGSYRLGKDRDTIPVIFIAAEGGALRTGAFTAMMLAKLQDIFPAMHKHIYCYSGVSGGALGSNFFNSVVLNHVLQGDQTKYSNATKRFFKTDFLASVTGKLVFGEIINYFIP